MPRAGAGGARRGGTESRFRKFLDDDWRRWMGQSPETATVVGYPGLNDRWTDDSPRGIAARDRHLKESAEALSRFDPRALDARSRLDHRLYGLLLRTALKGRSFNDDPLPFHFGYPRNLWMPLNQMDGIHIAAGQILPIQPRRTSADLEAIVARLRALPAAVDQTAALLEGGRRAGYVAPRVALLGLPAQVEALVPEDPSKSAVLESFRELPKSLPEHDRSRLTDEAREAYARSVRPAFQRLHRYLVDVYLPGARETIAASALPQGQEAYAHHVRWTTTLEQTPEEIHQIGLTEVRRARAEMEALVRSTGFSGGLTEFHRFLRTDSAFQCRSAAELIDRYRVIGKRIDPELARHFGRLPRLPYGVLPIPEFQAPSSPTAYYLPGSPPEGRPGIFYANTHDLASRPTWGMESLTLHEAVPGHHLQTALAAELEGVPEFRKHSGETSFVEGWGLYAESLGEEVGLYQDPYSKFGALDHDVWRSVRLVVDTGMHALGWSRDQAIAFFRENTGMSELDIAVEVDRYIVWPGQALAYKLGQLKIRELRTLAETALGERFDERAFHDVVLEEGGLPLGELEARVRAWIAARRPVARRAHPPARPRARKRR